MTEPKQTHDRLFTCPNESCRRTFSKPLKTLDLQTHSGVYDACPYCLSKVRPKGEKHVGLAVEKPQGSSKSPPCPHHLGYLAERADKGQVPDACLVCQKIISCLLMTLERK